MKAFISGVDGQDGSYLAELLLSKGYEVHGLIRRGVNTPQNIEHIRSKLHLHYGDMATENQLALLVDEIKPDEIYNLAGQSDVKISFEIPEYTGDVTGLGVTRMLEAIRYFSPHSKLYQASSSEMFGNAPPPQNEKTPLRARSPYGAAKIYGHDMVIVYRESYGIFGCNGILFNHESIPKHSPVIIKTDNQIDVLPIEDMFKCDNHRYEGLLDRYISTEIWTGEEWTKIIVGTAYQDISKPLKLVGTRQACYESTLEHIVFGRNNEEIRTKDVQIGQKFCSISLPADSHILTGNLKLARLLGFIAGDGHISYKGEIRLTGTDKKLLISYAELITNEFGWSHRLRSFGVGQFENCTRPIWELNINNDLDFGKWLRRYLYTRHSAEKRVPLFILNADTETKYAFWAGYYDADGRQKGNERYRWKGFTTKSATLCLGLIYLLHSFSQQIAKVKCEYRSGRRYYYCQLRTSGLSKGTKLALNEVIYIEDTKCSDGWFYDLQTETQTFATGANLVKVHNSERRGLNFVTRKISHAVASIYLGKQEKLELGNIAAYRDWGYAPDYVKAMWMMLQQEKPDDYVIGTGRTHTVCDFVCAAFKVLGMDWTKYTIANTANVMRPGEVNYLLADATKARTKLGWKPETSFEKLVRIMVKHDLKELQEAK